MGVGVRVSSFAPAVGDLEHVFLDLNRAGPPPAASAPDPAAPIEGPGEWPGDGPGEAIETEEGA